jgi:gp19|nr:MAG TPA: Minor structural protein [Caudoviricetes sp.]
MINMSDTFKSKIYSSERYLKANVLINDVDYETDIIKDFKYHSSIASNSFAIGSTNASTFEITLNKLVETIEENHEVKPYIDIIGAEKIPLGVFYIQEIKRDRNAKVTKIKCQDKMIYLNKLYTTDLAFPAKIRDVIQDISEKVKMDFVPTHISYNKEVTKPEKVSYREMLSYLAQIEGCFVVFDRYGKLEFRKFNRTQEKITKNNYFLSGLVVNDVEYKLNGITADLKNKEKTILASGSAVGNQINLVNPLMKQDYLDEVYNYLKQFIFKPYIVNWQGNPALEVGDFVQVEVANGQYIGVPVLDLQLNFSGGLNCKMSADVKTSTSTSYEYKGTLQKQIEFLNARVGADGTTIYADTKEPSNPKEGDTWFKPNGAYTDLYIYEKGKWVKKVSTGNAEDLVTKITTDEVLAPKLSAGIAKIIELDASRITTGYLHADRIKAGSITENMISDETKKKIVTKEEYNELVADNKKFKSEIGQAITKEIDKVKVGARNLLKKSSTLDKTKWQKWSATNIEHTEITDNDEWRDCQAVKFLGIDNAITSKVRGYYLLDTVKFEKDKTYTLGFDVINLSDFDINFAVDKVKLSKKVEVKAKENKRVDITFNRKDFDEIMIAVETELNQNPVFCVKNVKVEEGNKSTSWTPAIEDLEEIDKQLSNAIEYLSSDNKDLLKKYEGLNLENAKIRHQLSTALKQTRDEFLFQFNNYKQLLDETGKVMEQRFNDFSRYIRFKAGNIELGDINSPFKALITHEKISFLKGDVEVAYMSNNKLYITDAYVINSLRIGNFEFSVQENGNLSFRKAVD